MRYRPELDGIRALAVLAVIASHSYVPLSGGGWMGVALAQRSGSRNDYPVGTLNSFRVVRTLAVQP